VSTHYFFCASPAIEDIIIASIIVSSISGITKTKQILCTEKLPPHTEMFRDVDFVQVLPPAVLTNGRGVIHQDVFYNDTDVYINVWHKQLRGKFFDSKRFANTIKNIIKNCLEIIGESKWFLREKHFFSLGLMFPEAGHKLTQEYSDDFGKKACILPGLIDTFFIENNICKANFFSSSSTIQFFAINDWELKSQNFSKIRKEDLPAAITESGVVIAATHITLAPYNNFLKNKKVLLLSSDGMEVPVNGRVKQLHDISQQELFLFMHNAFK